MSKSYLPLFLLILLLKSLLMFSFISLGPIGLGPDEAQYWTWSQQLDWGYYSKPPGIAWQIYAGTALFGDIELGIRSVAILFSFLQSLIFYFLARSCGLTDKVTFWSSMAMAFCPIGIFGSLFAITDGGFLLFWTIALWVVVSALNENQQSHPLLLGAVICCGALFKWTIYAFWIPYLALHFFRGIQFKRGKSIFAMIVSLCGLLPSLWWNSQHSWATFRHVGSTMMGGSGTSQAVGNTLEFLGSQVILFSPVLFLLLCLSTYEFIRSFYSVNRSMQFVGMIFPVGFSIFIIASLFQKIQGNWSLLIYPSGIILIGWWAQEKIEWVRRGVYVSVVLIVAFIGLSSFQFIPYKMNPLKHNLGWSTLAENLQLAGYDPEEHFLVSDKYQTSSLLSFYGPEKRRAYFLNLKGVRNNQFCYWPGLVEEQLGKTGYFIWIDNMHILSEIAMGKRDDVADLEQYFDSIELAGVYPLIGNSKGMLLFKCVGYNGKEPNISQKF